MKVGWYKGLGLSCNNPVIKEWIYIKGWIQITKHWGIAIISSRNKKVFMVKNDKDTQL